MVISYKQNYLQVLNASNLELMTQPGFAQQWPLAVSGDGRMMATEASRGRLFLWDLEATRNGLRLHGLDWKGLPQFTSPVPPLVEP